MSSSEPRLPVGAGHAEVRAPLAPPLDIKPATPVPAAGLLADAAGLQPNHPNSPAGATIANTLRTTALSPGVPPAVPSQPGRARDALPPLVSFSEVVADAPPWLFSAALHMLAVIILGLIFVVPDGTEVLLLRFDYTENLGDDMTGVDLDVSLDVIDDPFDSALDPEQMTVFEEATLAETAEIEPVLLDDLPTTKRAPIQISLTGREPGMQQKLLDAYGGTGATQQAVMEGLRWLARYQGKRGLWSLQGRYTNGSAAENREAATGLALLAFQGAGFTPQGNPAEPFDRVVSRAWATLLTKQKEDGNFFQEGGGHAQLYTHAICTISVCELYGMTRDSKYRNPAQRAIDYCVKVQSAEGGWRYFPGTGSDLSVTGWFVMALQSARMAGLDVPDSALKRINEFLDSVSRESGVFYAYQPAKAATASMTAEGLLCRQYLGWERSDFRLQNGGNYLIRNLPVWENMERDVYYWYYATQVCHHLEGRHWRAWNDAMRVVLPAHQVQEGKERGSWDPQGDQWGTEGGRLYVTCLSIFMLEVYYRHLPIYQLENLNGR